MKKTCKICGKVAEMLSWEDECYICKKKTAREGCTARHSGGGEIQATRKKSIALGAVWKLNAARWTRHITKDNTPLTVLSAVRSSCWKPLSASATVQAGNFRIGSYVTVNGGSRYDAGYAHCIASHAVSHYAASLSFRNRL